MLVTFLLLMTGLHTPEPLPWHLMAAEERDGFLVWSRTTYQSSGACIEALAQTTAAEAYCERERPTA